MRRSIKIAGVLAGLAAATAAHAVPTEIVVRVLARDGKLVGNPAGSASVIVRDTLTGVVLASGKTVGSSGDTDKLAVDPRTDQSVITGPGDAEFAATIDLSAPRRITVEIGAPGLGAYGGSAASQTQWVLPGKSPYGRNGWMLTLPGFMVDFLKPARHQEVPKGPVSVPIEANIVLMCGCPLEVGGVWDPTKFAIQFVVTSKGVDVARGPLVYGGKANRFVGEFIAAKKGVYDIVVTAFDPASGNSGVAETTFEVDN